MKIILSATVAFVLASFTMYANCIQGNCKNGQGKKITTEGEVLEGRFRNSKLTGKGQWRSKTGDTYQGMFVDGLMNGKGVIKFKTGDIYIGEFSKGIFHGLGRYKFRNGDVYFGTWTQGRMSGRGSYTFASGKVIDGTFENGKPIETHIKRDKPQTQSDCNKSNNTMSSSSVADSEVTKNCNRDWCDEEMGIFTYSDGSKYIGEFRDGVPEGIGRCEYINGDLYEGGFKSHSPHGKGIMHFASGQKYAAIWEYGKAKEQILADLDFKKAKKRSENVFNERVDIYALVVGVATYNHMPSLKYTDDDAYQVYAFLKSPEGGAIPEDKIKVLIDDNATRSNILLAMDELFSRADSNDEVFLYISGHGLDGSFIPSDFDGYSNNITYKEITKIIDDSEAKSKICIADACHSGSMIASKTPYQSSLDTYYDALGSTSGGTALMMSSTAEEVSLEYSGLRQGVFSHFVLRGMKGEADADRNKIVTVTELFRFVANGVNSYTASKQTPVLQGNYDPKMPVAMIR